MFWGTAAGQKYDPASRSLRTALRKHAVQALIPNSNPSAYNPACTDSAPGPNRLSDTEK